MICHDYLGLPPCCSAEACALICSRRGAGRAGRCRRATSSPTRTTIIRLIVVAIHISRHVSPCRTSRGASPEPRPVLLVGRGTLRREGRVRWWGIIAVVCVASQYCHAFRGHDMSITWPSSASPASPAATSRSMSPGEEASNRNGNQCHNVQEHCQDD